MDLLTYPSGPRVRDKLSHGEADVFTFPKSLCTAVVIVTVHISARYQSVNDCSEKVNIFCTSTSCKHVLFLFFEITLIVHLSIFVCKFLIFVASLRQKFCLL